MSPRAKSETTLAATRRGFAAGARALAQADPVLADIIRRVGRVTPPPPREPFDALVRAILYQQLAGSAAAAILRRFQALYPEAEFPTPQALLATSDDALRSVGISRQKASYLKDLAARFADGTLSSSKLRSLPDDQLEAALTAVKGVGRWTADMFFIFTLHRLDVLPVGDLGLRKAVMGAYALSELPTPAELLALGERWRPYRSLATIYLWRDMESP
ncbi:MAG: DNA-3-methyladenine glycosylase 2 family protein [Dehalococcoidia bacterium]|nr:DNA-3-methyladenine glycosylase 2 family protein [Dehalococcoidia bacterium]